MGQLSPHSSTPFSETDLARNIQKLANLLLILISITLPLVAADIVLKALKLPRNASRTMLLSGGDLSSGREGFRRYPGHRNLEQSAIYDRSIAYRYAYASNNLGLISWPDIGKGQPVDLAIAGDSYAEGQGGFAWLKQWQQQTLRPRGLLSINYAIAGSGFEDFAVAARNARTQHHAQRLLVLFIEHDAYRPYQPMASNGRCSFYSNGDLDRLPAPLVCSLYGVVWHHVPPGLSNAQLIQESLNRQHYGLIPALNQLLQQASRPKSAKQTLLQQQAATQTRRFGPIPAASRAALQRIKALYGPANVLLVQLPDRPGQQASTGFGEHLQTITGLTVHNLAARCPLSKDQFHRLDNHPNSSGYRKLQTCVANDPVIRRFVLQAEGH